MRQDTDWIVVLSATRARILRGLPAEGEAAAPELVLRSPSKKLRDVMADKPGRSFPPGGGGRRAAMAYGSDPLGRDEREFLHQVVALLQAHRRAGEYDGLVVVAPPRMLGIWRAELPADLRPLVRREVAKNLTQVTAATLVSTLREELARR